MTLVAIISGDCLILRNEFRRICNETHTHTHTFQFKGLSKLSSGRGKEKREMLPVCRLNLQAPLKALFLSTRTDGVTKDCNVKNPSCKKFKYHIKIIW
jgi:hypothetical protein